MSLTHDESRLFATLWLTAGKDSVLLAEDAREVAGDVLDRIAMRQTPCARERSFEFDAPSDRTAPHVTLRAPDENHSSWVH